MNLQIGTYANYVGSHFWNLQHEYYTTPGRDPDVSRTVLFREASSNLLPYAPRLQAIDLGGAFGNLSLNAGTVLPDPPGDVKSEAWTGAAQTYRRERAPVGNWSDYLQTRFHPRTCFSLPGKHLGVSEFDKFDHGTEIASTSLLDDIYDNLRVFIEDCDYLGGIHVTADACGGFAGLTASYLSRLREELGTVTPLFVVGVATEPECNSAGVVAAATKHARRHLDMHVAESRLISQCIDFNAQYVPIDAACTSQLSYVNPVQVNMYDTSAVIALALSVAYTPLQITGARFSTAALCNLLRPAPFAVVSSLFTNFPVLREVGAVKESGFFYKRGNITKLSTRKFPAILQRQRRQGAMKSQAVSEIVSSWGVQPELGIHVALTECVTLPESYPRFFDERLGTDGRLKVTSNIDKAVPSSIPSQVRKISCLSGLATTASHGSEMLGTLGSILGNSTSKTSSRHTAENADLAEGAEKLMGLAEDYNCL